MIRPALWCLLDQLGACPDAVSWSMPFETRWEEALDACGDLGWVVWAYNELRAQGHIPKGADPFLAYYLAFAETLPPPDDVDGKALLALALGYVRRAAEGRDPEVETTIAERQAVSEFVSERVLGGPPRDQTLVYARSLLGAAIPHPDRYSFRMPPARLAAVLCAGLLPGLKEALRPALVAGLEHLATTHDFTA